MIIPFVLAYTVAGGMFASVYTGMVQFAIMAVGIVSLLVWTAFGPGFTHGDGLGIGDLGQLTDPAQGPRSTGPPSSLSVSATSSRST